MSSFRLLDQADLKNRRVLVRVDFNVPMQDGRVSDRTRIAAALPTIRYIMAAGGKAVLLSHFGRPDGAPDPKYSLAQIVPAVTDELGTAVAFANDCVGRMAEQAVADLAPGGVILMENTRFHPGETTNDPAFARQLARLGDVFVNDSFSSAHRAHASTEGLAHLLPAYAGLAMQAELEALAAALEHPDRPLAAVVGGAKVSTKIKLLENLAGKVDTLIIGGGMANTFLAAQGVAIGKSLAERDQTDTALRIIAAADKSGCALVLPSDVVVAEAFAAGAASETVAVDAVPDDAMILDLGPQSVAAICAAFDRAATLVWNGPLGAFEIPPFDAGTVAAARHAAELTRAGRLRSVAGGGDTVAALNVAGVADQFSYVSTAGGAFLEWLEGAALPGVEALRTA